MDLRAMGGKEFNDFKVLESLGMERKEVPLVENSQDKKQVWSWKFWRRDTVCDIWGTPGPRPLLGHPGAWCPACSGGKKLKSSEEERTKIEHMQAQARTLKDTHILEEGEELENVWLESQEEKLRKHEPRGAAGAEG